MLQLSHKHTKPEACLNCGYQFKDENNYCPSCGQLNHPLHVPFKHLVLEFLEGTIHLDTKIFQTFKYLLFKPGFLSREFNTGKRATYVPPVRIYIFVSFIFFLLVGILSGHKTEGKKNSNGDKESTTLIEIGHSDETPANKTDSVKIAQSKQKLDSLTRSGKFRTTAVGRFINASIKKKKEVGDKEFSHAIFKNISYLMFFLMPLFAFFVFIFNAKRGHYYYEFLIYSIHLHSFLFILFSIFLLAMIFFESGWFILAFFIVSVFYFIISMKNAFPQRTFSALWKSLSLVFIYGITIITGLIGTLAISLYLA